MANRTRDYYRKMRARAIHHKKYIDNKLFQGKSHWYSVDGKYSKGKIHCSCNMCNAKTSKHGYKISDIKKYLSLESQLNDVYGQYNLKIDNRGMNTHTKF